MKAPVTGARFGPVLTHHVLSGPQGRTEGRVLELEAISCWRAFLCRLGYCAISIGESFQCLLLLDCLIP